MSTATERVTWLHLPLIAYKCCFKIFMIIFGGILYENYY